MRCEAIKELLEEYIEGELSESKQKAVENHISACESCKKELALTRSIPYLVNSLSTPPVPEDIIPNTLKSLNEVSAVRWQWLGAFGTSLSGKWKLAAAASFVIVVVLLGIGYQQIGREPRISQAEVEEAMAELEVALGIVNAAAQGTQFTLLAEGAQILNATKSGSNSAIQSISHTQLEISEKLWRKLVDLAQLNL